MAKIALSFLIITLFILTQGCSTKYKEEVLKKELERDFNNSIAKTVKKPAIERVSVSAENFAIDRLIIPDKEQIKQVKILGAELHDVIALLTEATHQNIIFQLQSDALSQYSQSKNLTGNYANARANVANSGYGLNGGASYENNDEYQIRQSKVYVSASDISFGRLLKKAVGDKLSIKYNDGTYYLGYVKTVTVKVPALKGLVEILEKELQTLGAVNVVHDSITSSLTFSAREKEYLDIMNYLEILRNNLYVIEYDIAIYNVELKDNYSLGINWDIIPKGDSTLGFISKTAAALGSVGATTTPATFGLLLNTENYAGNFMVDALSQFGKVESIQRPKLLGLAGTDVTLVDGLVEPFIKELRSTAVGNNAVQTSTVSGEALSGLRVTLNSNVMDETILTNIQLEINDIVGYSNFEVDDVSYSQPKTLTKTIESDMRVQPGVPIVISGLFRHKSDKGYQGVPGLDESAARLLGGTEYRGVSKTEMVIIVTPRLIKYVMK